MVSRSRLLSCLTPVVFFALVITDTLLVVPPVFAQGQDALEEIVVTARKREESLQDTPISVTAFTGSMLEQQHIQTIDAISSFTPNVEFDNSVNFSGSNSAASVFIRGIGQVDFTLTTEPGVGIYVDGVYLSQSIGGVLNLVDIDTIEVLRGPQGTLFGRNTIGGAINVRTRKPDDKFHGEVEVTGGAYDRIDGRVSVNVPVSDTLAAKLSGATFNRNGFLSAPLTPDGEDLGEVNQDVARIALRWTPNDRLEANFSADYTRARESGVPSLLNGTFEGASLAFIGSLADPTSPTFVPPPAPLPPPSFIDLHNLVATVPFGEQGCFPGPAPPGASPPCPPVSGPNPVFGQQTLTAADTHQVGDSDRVNNSNMDLSSDNDVWGVALDLVYEFDWGSVRSITSYREMEAFTVIDQDGLPITENALTDTFDQDQFSQEIQISGVAFDGRLNWVIGGYHFEEDGINLDDVEFPPVHILSGAIIDNRSDAGFAQFTFDVTPKLSITGGIRFTDEQKKYIVDDTCRELPGGPDTLFDGTVVTCTPIQTVINPKFLNTGFLATVNNTIIDPATGAIIDPLGVGAPPRVCCVPISDADGNVVGLVTGLTPGQEVVPRGTTTSNFDDWTPRASIAYRWTDDFMTYFSYSEGFKSGGFVQRVFPPKSEVPSFGVETATVYEVGFKWEGFDSRVRVTAAGFHTDYDDLQIQVNDGIAPVTRNAAAAKIDGFELEGMAIPAPGWLVQAGVGYMDARYTELDPSQNFVTDLRNITLASDLVNAPDWSSNLGVQYTFPAFYGGELTARVDWSYRSNVVKESLNFPTARDGTLHLVDLALTYVTADERWEVSAFGKNVTDEEYIVTGFANGLTQGTSTVIAARPAEWGISVRYRFGEF